MKLHFTSLVLVAVGFIVMGASSPQQPSTNNSKSSFKKRYVENTAFGLGEKLDYRLGYKFITAGTARFEIGEKPIERSGNKCYDIKFDVRSLKSLEFLYKVRDRYSTAVDIDGIFPWEFEQSIREGNYSRDFKATFDQINNIAKTTEGNFNVPDYVHDIVSAFYYIRTVNLRGYKKNDIIYLKNFFDRESHDLGVKILGKQEVTVEAGKFRCIVIEPMIVSGGLFKSDGRVLLWLSDDDRKIPVKVSTKIPIGSVDAELTGYSGLRGSLDAKIG